MPGALILLAGLAAAQQPPEVEWEPIAVVRPRFRSDYTEGLALGFHYGEAVTHRARMGLQMTRDTVEARVVAQSASGWQYAAGDYRFFVPTLDFWEGWGRIRAELPARIHLEVTAGRIPVTVHQGRLVSADDFGARGNSLDGLQLSWGVGQFHSDTVTYRHPDRDPENVRGAVAQWIGFANSGPVTDWVADLVSVNDYRGPLARTTFGPHVRVDHGRFHVQSELYSQTLLETLADPVSETSVLASQTVGWTFGPERLVNVRARFDAATGDLLGDGQGFSAPLEDSYQYFGHLGLFRDAAGSEGRGVADGALLLTVRPHTRLDLELDGHQFWFLDGGRVAGRELDATMRYHVSPYARIEVGLWAFLPTPRTASRYDTGTLPASQYLQLEIGAPPLAD